MDSEAVPTALIIKELGIQERLATTVRKRVLKFFAM